MIKEYIKVIVLFLVVSLLVFIVPNSNSYNYYSGKLYISEILANNKSIILDKDMEYSDYIEIYNGYNYPIKLKGYYLSDDIYDSNKWAFPDVDIKAHEYMIIFASGKDKVIDGEIHTNFKLSSYGESVILTDNYGNIVSKIKYDKIDSDVSYGYSKRKYRYLSNPTPGMSNDSHEYKINNNDYKLRINEYMTHNKSILYDSSGVYYDWVEIYNDMDKDVLLENIYLTDDANKLSKYRLPKVKIKKKDYLIVYLSGKSLYKDNQIYANFKLSDTDELIISNGDKILDRVKIKKLDTDISYGIYDGKWYYFTTPTPGYKNNTAHFSEIGGINGDT